VNVGFWAASEDGSSWYRCDLPAAALTWRGHRVWASKVLPMSVMRWSDVIVGNRVVKPGPSAMWRQMHDAGQFLVMDFDDDYWHLAPDNPAHKPWNAPGVLAQLEANVRLAHRVTCVSQGLAEVLATMHDDVRVVPNGLHAMYLGAPRRYDSPRVRVGWAGTASTVGELHMVARALNRIVDYTAGGRAAVDLVFIGATPEALARQGIVVDRPEVGSIEWIDDNPTYLRALMGVDILVAPYRDTPFHRAKFATKALEAGFLGIPLIVSDIRPYREWADQRDGGGLALVDNARPHEWGRWLRLLVESQELRSAFGLAGRARAGRSVLQGDVGAAWEDALTPPDGFDSTRRQK
jgi:glycosyltransferase involved in cell wall biosynthesis